MKRLAAMALETARQAALFAAIVVAVFVLVRVIPGDVVDVLALEGGLTEAAESELRRDLGLAAGWFEQLAAWAGRALAGDLGRSLRFDRPVADMVALALPVTLDLAAKSLAIGLALGIALACAGLASPRWAAAVAAINVWSIAMPTFCIAVACLLVFSVWLKWLPAIGQTAMPALIVGLDIAGQLAKPLLEDLRENVTALYVRTARAKGLGPWRIVVRHVLPNSLAVVVALSGLIVAGLIGGTLTVEVLFGLPGLGTLALNAIRGRDYPLIQAVMVVLALGVILVNLATDLIQRAIDPRVA